MSTPRRFARRSAVLAIAAASAVPAVATAQTSPRLAQFPSCNALKLYTTAKAVPLVRATGYAGYPIASPLGERRFDIAPLATGGTRAVGVQAEPAAAAPATGGPTLPATSGTNVQERGVDEPDIVLSDPNHIITTIDDELRIYAAADTPQLLGRLRLPGVGTDAQMIRSGDRVMVFANQYSLPIGVDAKLAATGFAPFAPQTVIRLVDVANPAKPLLLETLNVDGNLVAARRPEGGSVRVVLSTMPDPIPFAASGFGGVETSATARRINVRNVRRAHVKTWLPAMRIRVRGSARPTTRTAVGCRGVARTKQFAGLGTLTVLTIDPATGLTPVDSDAVLSDGQIVYASPTSLYVTTPRWISPAVTNPSAVPDSATTEIHRFDISAPNVTEYRDSGRVPGFILNQFSLSEWKGVLRVASTRDPEWINNRQATKSESFVTTLKDDGTALRQLGQVGRLGTDERIYGVRFIDDRGYVVTFRQVDPLHVLDLADPASPRVTGELVIPGYSAYLHPVGPGLLLGVGQNADLDGRLKGTQISLFDVSNPTAPRRVQNLTLPDSWSEAENDHHAFLYWAPTGLAMIPFTSFTTAGMESGTVGVTVAPTGITRLGVVRHRPTTAVATTGIIRRSLVIGDRVFTVSNLGVAASRLVDLGALGFAAYPNQPVPTPLSGTVAVSPGSPGK